MASRDRDARLEFILSQKELHLQAMLQVIQQQFSAGATVAAGVVMVEFQVDKTAQGVKLVVFQMWIAGSSHLIGTGVV